MDTKQLIETVKRARRGDAAALQELYLDMYKGVFYLALRIVKNPEDAEDITQEVYITVQQKIAELREPAAFYGWVNQITVNQCNVLLRKYKGIARLDDEDELIDLIDDDPANLPDKALDDEATRKIILEVIDNLPDGQRACVILYYYTQNTIAQIADMLETNENTVKSRLALARAKIRAALEDKTDKEGIKLWGIPLALTPILREAFEQFVMPECADARIREFISKATAENMSAGDNTGVEQPESPGSPKSGAAGAAKTGMALATKIIIGVVAAAVITASVIFLPPLLNAPGETTPPGVSDTSLTQSGTETPANTPSASDPSYDVTSEPPTAEPGTSPEPQTTQPSTLPVDPNAHGNSVGNISNRGNVAIQGDRIYYRNYSDGRKLYSMNTDGSDKKKLNDEDSYFINVIGDRIYYQSWVDGKLYSMKTDGSDKQKLDDFAGYINVVGDKIYYNNRNLCSMNTDGSDRKDLNDDNSYDINVVGDWIYYSNMSDDHKMYKIKTDGSDRQKLNDDVSVHINVVGDRIYYRNVSDGDKIYSMNTDGSDRKKLNDDESFDVNVADDRIYYSNWSDGSKIYSLNTDGSGRKKLNDDESTFISVIGDSIYYCCGYGTATEKLYSMNTDGTDRRLVD